MALPLIADNGQQALSKLPEVLLSEMMESRGPAENLKVAFDVFNDLSLQLADSYQHLEQRVAELTLELDSISEQRYQDLKQKEQLAHRLEALIHSLPGGVVVLDKQGLIIESNPVAEALLESNLEGRRWREVVEYCFAPKDDDGHEVSNREGKRISIITRSLADDGQIILLTDQTETRRLQAELSRNERLSALGKMVSTLAHQVRTPLSSAMLYANHLKDNPLTDHQRDAFTQKLLNRLHYMERQVQDMLMFVKGNVPLVDKVSVEDLKHALAEAIEMPIKTYNARCQWKMAADHCIVQCNLDAVIGALLNLVNNSLQALPEVELTICFYSSNHELSICVLDNGPGLCKEFENKRDDMFFTTKEQGTGIGLSVVKIVAQSHGGHFDLYNREKGGVCACLRLPVVQNNQNN